MVEGVGSSTGQLVGGDRRPSSRAQFDSKATSGQGFSAMPPAANAPDLPLGMFVVF